MHPTQDGTDVARVVPLIEEARRQGARGFFFFRHGTMPEALIDTLAEGPFRRPAVPYRLQPRPPRGGE